MEREKSLSAPLQRITVIDALRGFALLGVFIAHILQRFSIPSGQREQLFPVLDDAIRQFSQTVISGKFIGIFAFLFGLSFFIQMDRAAKKGVDFRKRFVWRMAVLFLIGIVGNCFYTGDILSIYALFGIILVSLYRVKNWILLSIISLLLLGAPRIILTGYDRIVKSEQTENTQQSNRGNESPTVRSSGSNTQNISFISAAKNNLTGGMRVKLNREFGFSGRAYPTLALFVLGLVAGRLRFFEEVRTRKKRTVILFVVFVLAVVILNRIIGLIPPQPGRRLADATPLSLTVMALNDITRVVFSGALVMGFIILYHIKSIGKYLSVLIPYGRMGLTNYVVQSMTGCFIFSMWAFGSIFGSWGTTETFALGLAIYSLQIVASRYWLKYFLYGPFEWFWRSATYLKWQPLRRNMQ